MKTIRILLFLLAGFAILGGFYVLTSISGTLQQLKYVEAERDLWQRPADVIRALDLKEGGTVVDLGSGSGYFTLKLSAVVGTQGEVVATDLRGVSLFFLRLRAFLAGRHNIRIHLVTPDDPHLPAGQADAVLISNTYHEFANPKLILEHTYRSLRPGRRLVIVDRGPREEVHGHEASAARVESEVRQQGFETFSVDDRFIDRPGDDPWWLLVARRP